MIEKPSPPLSSPWSLNPNPERSEAVDLETLASWPRLQDAIDQQTPLATLIERLQAGSLRAACSQAVVRSHSRRTSTLGPRRIDASLWSGVDIEAEQFFLQFFSEVRTLKGKHYLSADLIHLQGICIDPISWEGGTVGHTCDSRASAPPVPGLATARPDHRDRDGEPAVSDEEISNAIIALRACRKGVDEDTAFDLIAEAMGREIDRDPFHRFFIETRTQRFDRRHKGA